MGISPEPASQLGSGTLTPARWMSGGPTAEAPRSDTPTAGGKRGTSFLLINPLHQQTGAEVMVRNPASISGRITRHAEGGRSQAEANLWQRPIRSEMPPIESSELTPGRASPLDFGAETVLYIAYGAGPTALDMHLVR